MDPAIKVLDPAIKVLGQAIKDLEEANNRSAAAVVLEELMEQVVVDLFSMKKDLIMIRATVDVTQDLELLIIPALHLHQWEEPPLQNASMSGLMSTAGGSVREQLTLQVWLQIKGQQIVDGSPYLMAPGREVSLLGHLGTQLELLKVVLSEVQEEGGSRVAREPEGEDKVSGLKEKRLRKELTLNLAILEKVR